MSRSSDSLGKATRRRDPGFVRDLPGGTVTFLFTDIEGSTRLLEELGDRYPEALSEHRRHLRDAFTRHGGTEVDTQGDAFFVAFPDAREAVEAAAEAQAALEPGPIRVRMGLHTGEPIVWAEGYAGLDVHRGARICACAHGGQVVLSERTRAQVDGVSIRDLGAHRLKDLSEPQQLYQLGDAEFPPLKTLHATNLPTQATALVGRQRELDEVRELLGEHRLVTLTGPGGSGKTRLGLQVAAEVLEDYPHGVFWVPLQSLRDPALVLPTVAQTIGSKNGLADHVGDKRMLLLLDNLEQVIEAAGELSELLSATGNARLLVTSREPLRVAGEHRYAVEPLVERDAVVLFLERARAVDPGFEPSDAVAQICRRLDGLPLALELAAARVSLLSPDDLLARLERALPVLTLGARDAPERQQTLRATIAWSHDLLDEDEQRLFRRLAVFAASFELDAVGPVCQAELETLQSLVDKSLVRRWGSGRFGMLETVHEFAEERLAESGDEDQVRRRHAEYYLAVAESANLRTIAEGEVLLDVGVAELDNIRRALGWALSSGRVELGIRLAGSVAELWVARDPFEGQRWFERLLERSEGVAPELRAGALRDYGGLVFIVGEFDRGLDLQGQSLAEFRALGDEHGVADVVSRLAVASQVRGDVPRMRVLAEESLELNRRLGKRKGEAQGLLALATVEWESQNRERAWELMSRSAALAREIGFAWWETGSLFTLCEWALELGRRDEAEQFGRDSLAVARRIGERMYSIHLLALLARIAAEDGRVERAGLLWGAVEAEEERGRVGQWEDQRETYAAPVLAHSGPEFERGREEGRRLSFDEGIERALER
jgi:predicted ATPase/class 3 adenylate cyclase